MTPLTQPRDTASIEDIVTHTVDELAPKGLFSFNAPRQTLMGEGAILKIGSLTKLGACMSLVPASMTVFSLL